MKRCSACGETKPLDQFNCNRAVKDRRQSRCRECQSKYGRLFNLQNKSYRSLMSKSPHVRNSWSRCTECELDGG